MTGSTRATAGILSAALCLTLNIASGQTTVTGGPTCPTVPASLTAFSIEGTLPIADILATPTPNIPANVLAAISGNAQEIRERLIYNPQLKTLTATIFLVAPGSPLPTPLSTPILQTTIQTYAISIDKIYQNCTPSPSILFVGLIQSSSGGPLLLAGPFGSLVGAPAAVSVGYTNASPTVLSNVATVVSGIVLAYSASASGTVTFPAVPVTPPGSNGGITLNPPVPSNGVFVTKGNSLTLDASANTGALTYSWTATPSVIFIPTSANAAIETVQFPSPGTYQLSLTITTSSGSQTLNFAVNFVGGS